MEINQIGVITFKNGKIDSKSSFEINRILHSSDKRSMNRMKIELKVGTRATTKDFRNTYKARYLVEHGWRIDSVVKPMVAGLTNRVDLVSVPTKYGQLVVKNEDMLTYVGNNVWDVRSDK